MVKPSKGVNTKIAASSKVPAKAKRAPGKPKFEYTEELAVSICDQIATGGLLHKICEQPGMPSHTTVLGWLREDTPIANPIFSRMYAEAVERRTEYNHDRLLEIASTPAITEVIVEREVLTRDGQIVLLREVRRSDSISARSLQIDAMKWSISKQGWKKYGVKPGGETGDTDSNNQIIITGGLPD